jgi:hypothetical protein
MATRAASTAPGSTRPKSGRWLLLGLLGGILLVLFYQSLDAHQILFANDAPLGSLMAECNRLPGRFAGTWRELVWLGGEGAAASPNITMILTTLLSAVTYLKIYAPFTLLFLGFSAWLFFRQLNLSALACVLGGVAAGLNGHFFSIACWGLGNWNLCAGCTFLAMAALSAKSIPKVWERAVLAGLAVGMGVMEGYDVGAILSVYIGIFIIFRMLTDDAPVVSRTFNDILVEILLVVFVAAITMLIGVGFGMSVKARLVVGAIFGVYTGAFIVLRIFFDNVSFGRRVGNVLLAELLVVFFASIIAFHTMKTLIETQVEGVASMEQDAQSKQARWHAATQWSLPKLETLQVFVPGLFGYRLSGNITQTNHSGAYWGLIGQDARIAELGSDNADVRSNVVWGLTAQGAQISDLTSPDPNLRSNALASLKLTDTYLTGLNKTDRFDRTEGIKAVTKKSGIYWRYSGSGECAGIMVSLLALFSLSNFFRKDRPFSKPEHIAVGYWGVVLIFSLLASWGRFGFVYQLLYKLPYFSTIRNPIKFMNPVHIALIILAAYGMEALYRRYLRGPERTDSGLLLHHLQLWWAKVTGFDRRWTIFMMILAGASVTAAILLYAFKGAFVRYLEEQNFPIAMAAEISVFCLQRVFAFLVFLAAGIFVLAAIVSGAWSGSRYKWAWSALALLIICDLVRADVPWIHYYDYAEKYEDNPVVEFLTEKPWEHRVIGKLEPRGPGSGIQPGFGQLYFFWLQNDFPYRNIQALDFSQAPHMPDMDRDYLKAFELKGADYQSADLRPAVRLWELTNTRYLLGSAQAVDFLNRRADATHQSFRLQRLFSIRRKPGVQSLGDIGDLTVQTGTRGDLGIIEDTHALPRAKLYSNWRTPTNDAATLATLANPEFEPWDTVLLATNSPVPQPASSSTADPGTVAITDYHPKHLRLEADAKTPAVLLLNDRTCPDWHVLIDGAPSPVLRCNYIMRGVYLTPGHHIVEFQFKPSLNSLYVSVSAIVIGIVLAGYLILTRAPLATQAAPEYHATAAPASPTRPSAAPTRPTAPPTRPPASPTRPTAVANVAKGQKGNGKGNGKAKGRN